MRVPPLFSYAALAAALLTIAGVKLRQALDLRASRRDPHPATRARYGDGTEQLPDVPLG